VHNLVKNYCLGNLDFFFVFCFCFFLFCFVFFCFCLGVIFQIVSFFVKIDVCVSEFRILFGESTFCSVHQRRQTKQCTRFPGLVLKYVLSKKHK
jgi:hypothetical protein